MARKNRNAVKGGNTQHKLHIPRNHHFMYSTDEFGANATVVRYLGEQEGDYLFCYHPEGFAMWIHVHQLWNSPRPRLQAA